MKRKFLVLLVIAIPCCLSSQESNAIIESPVLASKQNDSLFGASLKLVDAIRNFIRSDLKLDIGEDFYTKWTNRTDSMYVFLYASRKDSVCIPQDAPKNLWYFDREDFAITASEKLKKNGYVTLVYRTAGMSNALLNRKLLSYPDEALAFILFHEATHRHIGTNLEYNYVEALCDAMAVKACARFAEKTKLLDPAKVKMQNAQFERIYKMMNRERIKVDKLPLNGKMEIFRNCTNKISAILKHANQFVKDRMGYEVNNAYFLRVKPYAFHFFEMKKQLEDNMEIDKITSRLLKTDRNEPDKAMPNSILLPSDSSQLFYPWNSR